MPQNILPAGPDDSEALRHQDGFIMAQEVNGTTLQFLEYIPGKTVPKHQAEEAFKQNGEQYSVYILPVAFCIRQNTDS